ncbi:dethiobiotin synthase [Halobacteriales archaeon QS_4_69_225]|nr:MAG: dethiobiotin synthase [Halobacteriales archaeon QS_4_69_225]
MNETVAVVGTDTGVGKTVVTAALVARLRRDGVDARAVKPAQTGFPEDDDAGYVRDVCSTEAAASRLRTFGEPLAPAVAARRADDPLAYEPLLEESRAALDAAEVGVLEGAGGLRVPLSNEPRREIVDLVADLSLPALVVARSGLGTLNHTALTVEALRGRDVDVLGVALNRYGGASVAERTNPDELERMCGCPVGTLPETPLGDRRAHEALVDELPHKRMGEELPL